MALPLILLQWFANQQNELINHPFSFFFLLLLFSSLLLLNRARANALNISPPGPRKLPIIGHLHLVGKFPHRSFQALSQKYGPLMLLQLGYTPTVVVSSAEMGREIMKTRDAIFASRPITTAAKAFVYGGKDIAFAPNGDHWRQARKICVMDLLSVKRVQSFRFIREEEITIMINKLKQVCLKDVNLSDLLIGVINNLVSRAALGMSLEGEEGTEITKEVIHLFGKFSVGDWFPSLGWIDTLTGLKKKMKKSSKAMHTLLDEVIEEHVVRKHNRAQTGRKDLVDILLESENDPTLRIKFTREHHRAVIADMFVAGTETTYTALEWTMAELMNHPNEMKKLQEEIRRVVGTKGKVDESDISEMHYLNCVIKESLRLHPPVVLSVPRESTESATIEGYHIPAKTRVVINLWAISRDPKVWDRPNEFLPERFINSSIDFRGNDFELIPFGAGRRGCPGLSFGVTSLETVLANLLYWFDWELSGGAVKIDMAEAPGKSVHLKHPLHLIPVSHF